jgi:putative transposase
VVTTDARRELVAYFGQELALSERRACRLASLSRSVERYERSRPPDDELRERLHTLAMERARFGYRRLAILLKREGVVANHKRIWYVYSEAGLSVRTKRRKRVAWASRRARSAATRPKRALVDGLRERQSRRRQERAAAQHRR